MGIDTSKYKNLNQSGKVPQEVNKRRYWIVSIITNLLLGIVGILMIAIAYMYVMTQLSPNNSLVIELIGIGAGMLVAYFMIFACNQFIYAFFLRFSPLPSKYMVISNVVAWAVTFLLFVLAFFSLF